MNQPSTRTKHLPRSTSKAKTPLQVNIQGQSEILVCESRGPFDFEWVRVLKSSSAPVDRNSNDQLAGLTQLTSTRPLMCTDRAAVSCGAGSVLAEIPRMYSSGYPGNMYSGYYPGAGGGPKTSFSKGGYGNYEDEGGRMGRNIYCKPCEAGKYAASKSQIGWCLSFDLARST